MLTELLTKVSYIKDLIILLPNVERIRLFIKTRENTMVTPNRLNNLFELAEHCEEKNISGSFVECGVWKGGSAAVMAYVAKKYHSKRKFWLFDSFAGLPEPTKKDGLSARRYAAGKIEGKLEPINECVASVEEVKMLFNQLGINWVQVRIKKGWFQKTLPTSKKEIGSIALLRLDGDWYESIKVCFDNLYNQVVVGGYVSVDDYWRWQGCHRAVDDFFQGKNKPVFHTVERNSIYFQKTEYV